MQFYSIVYMIIDIVYIILEHLKIILPFSVSKHHWKAVLNSSSMTSCSDFIIYIYISAYIYIYIYIYISIYMYYNQYSTIT